MTTLVDAAVVVDDPTLTVDGEVWVLIPAEVGPTAALSLSAIGAHVDADASSSTAGDAAIATYWFDWGDSDATGPQVGVTAEHVYADPGNYTVLVLVEDVRGNTDYATGSIAIGFTSAIDISYLIGVYDADLAVAGTYSATYDLVGSP